MNGFALGGGFEIALSCDIIIAAEHARFGLPEPRVGLMAAAGGVHRLPRQIPLKIAMGMMLTGKHITAADALRYGIANEVVPLKDLIPTAEKWAARDHGMLAAVGAGDQGSGDERPRDCRSEARSRSITICSRSCSDRKTQWRARWHSRKSENPTGPASRAPDASTLIFGSPSHYGKGLGVRFLRSCDPMNELWLLHDAIATLLAGATTAAFPPIGTGAFWTIVAFYGVVSILFDDETPRGVPGMDYFYATRPHLKDPQS